MLCTSALTYKTSYMTELSNKQAHRNIILLRVFFMLRAALIIYTVLVPYLVDKGLDKADVFLLQGVIYSSILVFLDVPAGYIADNFGRRRTLTLGGVILFIGHFLMYIGDGWSAMVLSFIFAGVGASLLSGVHSALLFDTLKSSNQEARYAKQEAKLREYGYYSTAVSGLMGGVFFSLNVDLPIILTMSLVLMCAFVPMFMYEPQFKTKRDRKKAHLEIFDSLHFALKGHDEIKWLLLLAVSIMPMTWFAYWLAQSFWMELGIDETYFGFLNAALLFASAAGTRIFPKLLKRFPVRLICIVLLSSISLAFLMQGWIAATYIIAFQLLISMSFGIAEPMFTDLINRRVDSDIRATMISVLSFVNRLGIVFVSIAASLLPASLSAADTMFYSGFIVMAMGTMSIIRLKKSGVF